MSVQYAVDLRQTAEPHTIVRHVMAENRDRANAWVAVFTDFSLTKAGETEVVLRVFTHPDRAPQAPCGGARVIDEVFDGVWTTRGCPGCPDCTAGAR